MTVVTFADKLVTSFFFEIAKDNVNGRLWAEIGVTRVVLTEIVYMRIVCLHARNQR